MHIQPSLTYHSTCRNSYSQNSYTINCVPQFFRKILFWDQINWLCEHIFYKIDGSDSLGKKSKLCQATLNKTHAYKASLYLYTFISHGCFQVQPKSEVRYTVLNLTHLPTMNETSLSPQTPHLSAILGEDNIFAPKSYILNYQAI